MGNRIHTRIFSLVLSVILLLTVSAWIVFLVTSRWYADITAERSTERTIQAVERMAEELYRDAPAPEDRSPDKDREYSKELLKRVRQAIRNNRITGTVLVFNSRLKQVYPADSSESAVSSRLSSACATMIEGGQLTADKGTSAEAGGENWKIRLYRVETENPVRAKYFIAAVRVPEMGLLWNYAGRLLLFIAAVTIGIAALLIWMVAAGIARPIEQLCRQAEAIGNGKSAQIEDVYSVRELEMLKNAYNRMESKLRESQREKEFFFQNISHDLRTPLASIIGYAQGIQCGVMTDCHKAAGIILSESMRMMSLTESILTLTKMDCHELKLHMAEIDLEEFLEQRLDALSGMAGGEKLKMEPQGLQLYVRADPDLFGRIVENIISNCIRYGKHEVTVRCERDKELAVILIEDDGTGFCTEEIPRAFERFYQGKGGGFGIGLSVVQAGMEYLGGHVEIGNRKPPKHGAFYRLTLPCVTSETRFPLLFTGQCH